jgi:hypothetical protein
MNPALFGLYGKRLDLRHSVALKASSRLPKI